MESSIGLLFIIAVVVLIIIVLVFVFNSQSYHKVTGNGYFETMNNKGRYGEYHIYKKLQYLEGNGARFLFNLYIPKAGKENETTEIDAIVILDKGILVIESKNYGGWIFGDENSQKWCQSLYGKYTGKQKYFFYNPIKQNYYHIKALKKILEHNGISASCWSVIVFPEDCEFKKMTVYSKDTFVVKANNLKNTIDTIEHLPGGVMQHEDTERIYDLLFPYSQVGNDVKAEHISNITRFKDT